MLIERLARRLSDGHVVRKETREHNGEVVEFLELDEEAPIARWLAQWGKAAICLGRIVLLRDGRTNPKRIRHELVHVDQWLTWGMFYVVVYPFRWKKFEAEAEAAEKVSK